MDLKSADRTGETGQKAGGRLYGVGIAGTGRAVPERVLTNADLEKMVDTSDQWIVERTGIRERHIAPDGVATSDLAVQAAREALEDSGLAPEDIDLIIVATVTGDMVFPSTACIVQSKIGASNATAFDISAGCSGFVYALSVGAQFIRSGANRNVLIIGAEILSRIVDWTHRNTCVLFGDGAGACVLRRMNDSDGILSIVTGADGSRGDILKIPAGGSLMPASHETVENRLHYIKMEGNQVYKFAVRTLAEASSQALNAAGIDSRDIKLFIPHQANKRLMDIAAERLGIQDRAYSNVEWYGNTSAASIPIALDEAVRSGKIREGDLILLTAFGAGLTWGSTVIRWCKDSFRK